MGFQSLANQVVSTAAGAVTKLATDNASEEVENTEATNTTEVPEVPEVENTMLDKAHNAYRELNQRIDATRQLKFSLDSATERLKALKGGK